METIVSAEAPVATSPSSSYHTAGASRWPHEDAINRVLEGTHRPGSRAEAIALLQERFGCAFKRLPVAFQEDPDIAMEAAVRSSGHELAFLSGEARSRLSPLFFMNAIERGAAPWIVSRFASDAVKADPRVQDVVRRNTPVPPHHKDSPRRNG